MLKLLLIAVCAVAQPCTFVTQRVQCGALTCNKTTSQCGPCVESSDCFENAMGCHAGKCVLDSLASAFTAGTIFAPLCGFIICAIAVVAGVGGGGILVVLYRALLGVPMSTAVGLSQATIAGQSFLNMVLQIQRHHPHHLPPRATRPIINYEYLTLMLPFSLVGTLLGELGNQVSSDWFRVVSLFVLLTYILYRLIIRIRRQRERDAAEKLLPNSIDDFSAKTIDPNLNTIKVREPKNSQEKPQYPIFWIATITWSFGIQFAFSYLKGSHAHLVGCGQWGYWAIIGGSIVYSIIATVAIRSYLLHLKGRVKEGELPDYVVPFKWNWKSTVLFPLLSVVAGGAASMLGIGGGLVLSFLLLEAGITPEATAATGGLATFLVAFQFLSMYLVQGLVRWDYGLLMIGTGAASTLLGQFVFVREITKRGWSFMIIVCLAFIMIGSMIALTILGVYSTVKIEEDQGSLGFGELCK